MQRLTGNTKSFVCNCALVCLANTAGELANVSSAASQRLIGEFILMLCMGNWTETSCFVYRVLRPLIAPIPETAIKTGE